MSELLSSITSGGSGGFLTKYASRTINVSPGATGTYITLTPPLGQKVKLTALGSMGARQTNETTINVGGSSVVTGAFLEQNSADTTDADDLLIGYNGSNQDHITGDTDEIIEISTNVATSQSTAYTYQFGE
jgi:hypothetical protein